MKPAYDLPFRYASFELLLMLEVIEHLADIPHALSRDRAGAQARRRSDSIDSEPAHLSSRLHHLLTGSYKGRRAPLSYRYRVEDGRNWHMMGLNDYHWMSYGAGLRMDRLGRSRRKARAFVLVPLLYVPIALASWWLYVRGVRDAHQRKINRDLLRFMTSASLLMDDNIVMWFARFDRERSGDSCARKPSERVAR